MSGPRAWWLASGLLVVAASGWLWWRQRPLPVAVDLPLAHGAVLNPTPRLTGELVLQDRPASRIRLVNLFNRNDPASAAGNIAALKRRGVRLFITTPPSNFVVPSLGQFARGDALAINASAASSAISGRNDFLFRVVPDVVQEQRAIAAALQRWRGRRLLVLQDTGNLSYTKPALASFRAELQRRGGWRLEVRPLHVSAFDPRRDRALMQGNFDALYVLAGSFQPAIGNISQLWHQLHPTAPILLTPWARSPAVVANAGPAAAHTWLVSPYPARRLDPRLDHYLQRFERRYGYTPYAMAFAIRQALELLDQALASGASSPAQVKRYLLAKPEHPTSFGPIRFDAHGDVQANFHVFPASADRAP